MSRLTKKLPNDYYEYDNYGELQHGGHINKLGQLEDIEEELGIDLITLFKALKNGIYVVEKNDNFIVEDNIRSIEHWKDGWGITTNMEYLELSFTEYGKTWALTKEELEDEKSN